MHLVEIIIFSLYHVIVTPTKLVNNLIKDCKILIFKVIFQYIYYFLITMSYVEVFQKMCPIFVDSFYNFAKGYEKS